MLKSFIINTYLAREFLKITFNLTMAFFSLGFILNLFEEINFFKDFNIGINVPITLSFLFVPSLIYNMFPFLILLSGIWFFLKIKKTDEIIALKICGMSNMSIIIIPSIITVLLGIFFITSINPITSVMIKKYESIKNVYEKEQDYLATVNTNGIWIKEKTSSSYNIIRASNLNGSDLINLSIYKFDNENNFMKRIDAKSADISTFNWVINGARVVDKNGKIIIENEDNLLHKSLYDIKKIKSLYSNLDTISFWNLDKEIKVLENRGYSTREMRAKLQRSLTFPLFLLSMIFLSGVFTLGMQFKENNWTYIFIAILTSVLIFYFNDFSAALGKTDKLPVEISVWMPILIIFIFSSIGLIHANQK